MSTLHRSRRGLLVAVSLVVVLGSGALAEDATTQPTDDRLDVPTPENLPEDARRLRNELDFVNPALDGFGGELLNGAGGNVLKSLGKALGPDHTVDELAESIHPSFECTDLRPDDLEQTFEQRGLEIRSGATPGVRYTGGLPALVEAAADLAQPFDGRELMTKFKIDRVSIHSDTEATTSVIYLAMGTGPDGYVQQNARWEVRWDVTGGFEHPRLRRIDVNEFQENRVPRQVYSDCTEAVFDAEALARIRRGVDHWWGKIDAGMGYSFYGDYGIALGDVDNDGLDDLYLALPGGVPNRLYRHNPDGTLTDISARGGVSLLNDTPTTLIADLDNDGNQDLVVGTLLYMIIMRGDGDGRFEVARELSVDNPTSMSSADYDGDGLLDLYICRYSTTTRGNISGASVYDSDDGRPNVLLRNEGRFRFRDVTVESGIDDNNRKFSFSSVWEDYDNDGDLDVYVANDFGRNNLYRNTGGVFVDVAGEAGVEDQAAGMGATWSDYNQDGYVDLYVSNMFSSAGGRIVDKPQIASISGAEAVTPLQRFAKGNTLLENQGDGTFRDVSFGAGVTMGRWSWGGEFVDFNNDGWDDLVVPNGFVTNHLTKDL